MMEHGDVDGIAAWQPASVKIINPDAGRCGRAFAAAPAALFVLRDHPLSEQHADMLASPEATGKRHAQDYAAHVPTWAPMIPRERIVVTGVNEPEVWAPNGPALVTRYYVAFCDECRRLGLTAGALNLSVGWPANTGTDTPPDWTPFEPVRAAIVRGGHYMILHEYWDHRGPQFNWRWWAGRYLQCPWAVPIVIGECGMDEYVGNGGVGMDSRGWANQVGADAYMSHLAWYDEQLRKDGRIHSAQIFTWDFAQPWGTFDIRPIRGKIVAHAQSIAGDTGPVDPPIVVVPPSVPPPTGGGLPSGETATDPITLAQKVAWWCEEAARATEAGNTTRAASIVRDLPKLAIRLRDTLTAAPAPILPFPMPALRDVVDTLPHNGQYSKRPMSAITNIVVHHTVARADATPEAIAAYHVNDPAHKWPGIGYHFYIPGDGTIYQTNRLESVSYHVGNENGHCVGIALGGTFTTATPTGAQIEAAARLIAWLLDALGLAPAAVVGHRDLPGQSTQCPGNQWNRGAAYRNALMARVGVLLGVTA